MRELNQHEIKQIAGAANGILEEDIHIYSAAYAGLGYFLHTSFENVIPWHTPLITAIYPFVVPHFFIE